MTTNNSPLYLPKGGLVGLPPAGEIAIFADASGNVFTLNGAGAVTAIGGGVASVTGPAVNNTDPANPKIVVPANWFAASLAFIQSQVPALRNPVWTAEFTPNPGAPEIDIATATGTGSTSLLTTVDGGVLFASGGASAGGLQIARNKNGNSGQYLAVNAKTSVYACVTRAQISQSSATATLKLCCISDELTGDIELGVIGATSAVNWSFVIFGAAAVDSGVAFDTNWHDLLFIADGANIKFYVGDGTGNNFVQIGAAQPQSAAGAVKMHWLTYATSSNTTPASHRIDKAMVVNIDAA